MSVYDVTVAYWNLDVEDLDVLESVLTELDDAHLTCVDGQSRITAAREAFCAQDAVEDLVSKVHDAVPDARPEDVHLDLVAISDIAHQTDLSRETVRLYTTGARGHGDFPRPIDTVGDRIKVWAASDVWEWLREHKLPHPDGRPLTPTEVSEGNRVIVRLRRQWQAMPALVEAAHWHTSRANSTSLTVRPTVTSASIA